MKKPTSWLNLTVEPNKLQWLQIASKNLQNANINFKKLLMHVFPVVCTKKGLPL